MARLSVISIVCLTATTLVASAGWLGVRLDGPGLARDTAATVGDDLEARRRAAWQPSPVPSQGGLAHSAGNASAGNPSVTGVKGDEARRRAAWQPSPVPTADAHGPLVATGATVPVRPALPEVGAPKPDAVGVVSPPSTGLWHTFARLADAVQDPAQEVRRIAARIADLEPDGSPEPLAGLQFSTYDELFTSDRLNEMYKDGVMPPNRGRWSYPTLTSTAAQNTHELLVWTPPGYETSGKTYPTLYLLHGAGSPSAFGVDEWLGYAITEDLDRLIDSGFIEPMIVVLPFGAQGYWVNHADGGPQWSDYVTDEVVPYVDREYRTDARRERRAIGGLSMGGHGALQMAYRRPDLFAVAGAHSPTIRPYEESPTFFGNQKHFSLYDPLTLASTSTGVMKVTTWVDLGNEDKFRASTARLRDALNTRGAELHFNVFEGEHEGWYWMGYLPEYLRFYSRALYADTFTPNGAPMIEADSILLTANAQPLR
jgi:enterochelin esterase-like enzyme